LEPRPRPVCRWGQPGQQLRVAGWVQCAVHASSSLPCTAGRQAGRRLRCCTRHRTACSHAHVSRSLSQALAPTRTNNGGTHSGHPERAGCMAPVRGRSSRDVYNNTTAVPLHQACNPKKHTRADKTTGHASGCARSRPAAATLQAAGKQHTPHDPRTLPHKPSRPVRPLLPPAAPTRPPTHTHTLLRRCRTHGLPRASVWGHQAAASATAVGCAAPHRIASHRITPHHTASHHCDGSHHRRHAAMHATTQPAAHTAAVLRPTATRQRRLQAALCGCCGCCCCCCCHQARAAAAAAGAAPRTTRPLPQPPCGPPLRLLRPQLLASPAVAGHAEELPHVVELGVPAQPVGLVARRCVVAWFGASARRAAAPRGGARARRVVAHARAAWWRTRAPRGGARARRVVAHARAAWWRTRAPRGAWNNMAHARGADARRRRGRRREVRRAQHTTRTCSGGGTYVLDGTRVRGACGAAAAATRARRSRRRDGAGGRAARGAGAAQAGGRGGAQPCTARKHCPKTCGARASAHTWFARNRGISMMAFM
jgi:hypothetical protein